jgi:hypothetical protein
MSSVARPARALSRNRISPLQRTRAQRRRLAGAVGAEQGYDAALAERKINAVQRLVRPIEGA